MATWDELVNQLRRRTRLTRDDGDRCDFAVRAGPERRRAVVRRLAGGAAVALSVDLYPAARLPARDALAENLRARLGAFAREEERYILRAVLPLAALPAAEIEAAIGALAGEAAELLAAERERRSRPQGWLAAVDMYA